MKTRFWRKTYLLTLLLFLFCLYAGLFSLAFYTYGKEVDNAEDACRYEQSYIVRSFERDYADLTSQGGETSPSLLMESYGRYYSKEGIQLSFQKDGRAVYSSGGKGPDFENAAEDGKLSQTRIGGERFIVITSPVCEDEYSMLYAKNVSSLDSEFRALMTTYSLVAAAVSGILAVSLFFILKKLSLPLERLRGATEKISSGDMSFRADESGNDEFSALAKSFNVMVDTVKGQMNALTEDAERKQALVDNMAHEMRTPLTSIRGYAEYIEKAAVPDEEKNDAASRIVAEADRLKRISEKILDTAFIRGNKLEKQKVDLSKLLGETSERFSVKAAERGVTVETDLGECFAQGDAILLSLLLDNLTDNAIKACAVGGKVILRSSGNAVCVADNGKGMTEEQLSRVTEPFYRTDKSRSRAEGGAGLGLALCKQIADSHGAEMRFESTPGEGTEVKVIFP